MKRLTLVTGILALAAPLALAQTSTWKSDPAHSEVDFTILHLAVSHVHGRFGHVAATIALNEADITKSTVTATIDVTGVSTGEPARDSDLKSSTFFGVDTNPTATFTSTSVSKNAGGTLSITGNLALHGVTKPVVLLVEGPTAPVSGMDHKKHVGFEATTIIKRSDFGIGTKFPAAILGDDVKITIELDAAQQ
jgi:polyisoprenoid-binding protein YceI